MNDSAYSIAFCGLDCSTCEEFLATKENNLENLQNIAKRWSDVEEINFEVTVEDVRCDGCRADKRKSFHCTEKCRIRKCCLEKGFESCIECEKYPCPNENSIADHIPDIVSRAEA